MSALCGLAVNGAIPIGGGPIDHWHNGIPYNAAGEVATSTNSPAHWQNGLPFTNTGLLCAAPGGTVDHWLNGLPITPFGLIAVNAPLADHWSSGTPFNVLGQVITT